MPKILITGNGFDINEHLPTKYSDFLSITNFILNNHETDFNSIYSNIDAYKNLENAYKSKVNFDIEIIKRIEEIARRNQLFIFFKDEYEIDTWIDFENRIEYLLKIIFDYCSIINKNIFSKNPVTKQKQFYDYTLFDNKIEIAEVLAKFNIVIKEDKRVFSLNPEYLSERFDFFTSINYKKISNHISSLLEEFSELFNLYLQGFVFPLYEVRKVLPKNIFKNINKHFTFNYTPTFNKFYGQNANTSFLHGKSNNKNHNIILGIDNIDLGLINEPNFLKFTKYYQKYSKRTDFFFLNELSSAEKRQNFEFYFWGHSLDRSDSDYINEVFDFITELKQPKKSIIIVYHSESSYNTLLLNLFNVRGKRDIEQKLKNKELIFLQSNSTELEAQLNNSIKKPEIRIV